MSTRCQIGFYAKGETNLNKYNGLIYRHCDGYPEEGVLPDIMPFLRWFNKARGLDDLDYAAARLLQYLCNIDDGQTKAMNKNLGHKQTVLEKIALTGIYNYGILNRFQDDIEYFYAIHPDKIDIFEVDFNGEEAPKDINDRVKLIKTETI